MLLHNVTRAKHTLAVLCGCKRSANEVTQAIGRYTPSRHGSKPARMRRRSRPMTQSTSCKVRASDTSAHGNVRLHHGRLLGHPTSEVAEHQRRNFFATKNRHNSTMKMTKLINFRCPRVNNNSIIANQSLLSGKQEFAILKKCRPKQE